jgi:hypothetical protein
MITSVQHDTAEQKAVLFYAIIHRLSLPLPVLTLEPQELVQVQVWVLWRVFW